jgi:hypothetical protein
MITIEDLKDFDTWKMWKNGEVELFLSNSDSIPLFNWD